MSAPQTPGIRSAGQAADPRGGQAPAGSRGPAGAQTPAAAVLPVRSQRVETEVGLLGAGSGSTSQSGARPLSGEGGGLALPDENSGISDVQRALDMCAALCADTGTMRFLVIPGDPYSKSRPRFSRNGRTYIKKEDREQEEFTGWHLRNAFERPMTGNVALGCVFFRPNRQRIDADNMLKHVCDAANGIAYLDDSQVTAIMGLVELDAVNPRTLVMLGEHRTSMTRGTDATKPCEICSQPISLIGTTTPRRYCSPACATAGRGQSLAEPVPCAGCGAPFRRKAHNQKYCGQACVNRRKPRPNQRRTNRCLDCGGPVSKASYKRCRACWSAARNRGDA